MSKVHVHGTGGFHDSDHAWLSESSFLLEEAGALALVGRWAAELGGRSVWSKECWRILGMPGDRELTLASALERIHRDDLLQVQAQLSALAAAEVAIAELVFRVLDADGCVRWIFARAQSRRDARGATRLLGVVQDITEQRHALAEGGARAHERSDVEGGARAHERSDAEGGARAHERSDVGVRAGAHERSDAEGRARAHERVDVEGRAGAGERSADDLRASEERHRGLAAIVEWSNDAIVGCDLEGAITSWNRGATRLFGYREDEVLKRPAALIVPEGLRAESSALHARALRGEVVEHHVTVRRRKDGSHVEVSLTMSPIRDAAGKVVGLSKIARDLTDQRRAEQQLRRAEQQLRDAQKMEAVGLLAGGIAHDFNNMLSAIVGYTELVLENLPATDPLRADILEVRKAGASAVSLTRQLLAFSRRQVLSPRVIDLNQIVDHLERMVRRLFAAHVTLVFEQAPDLGRVSADPGQIEQVIMNLVLNARDAMAEGGTLTLSTANGELSGAQSEALGVAPGRYVLLAVRDTGCGIDPPTRARIFEPFFTTKEKGRGTGLGLSTALGIVQQSGGAIELESTLGVGTVVRVYLPRTEQPVQSAYSVPPARLTARSWETILLVEDEEQVRTLARTALRRQGFQVLEAEQGAQALALCQQHAGNIHLLLTDVVMPGMGGRELAARAAALRPEMKVLFMSGYAHDEILRSGVLDDEVALLQKPITPSSLTRKVREVLDAR